MTRSQIDNIDCHIMLKETIKKKNQKMPFCTMSSQFFMKYQCMIPLLNKTVNKCMWQQKNE